MKIVPESFIRLNKVFWHARSSTLSSASSIIRCILIIIKI
jgi:hypothetical protein